MRAIDLFAGPGGWDEGIANLGVEPLGIELDEWACATREARGHPTLRGDVAALNPRDFAPCDLLIASPPCQAFSAAGKRDGELDAVHIYACLRDLAAGVDQRDEYLSLCADERSLLVVEPFRWALALRPALIAFEQVPPVLSLWKWIAERLREVGYSTWAGLLQAERYGVPQTRERAFLMASLAGHVGPPSPTHQEYRPGIPAAEQHTLEGTLLPWVSMADALGWGMTERPIVTVTAGGGESGGPEPIRSRATLEREREERGSRAFRLHRGAGMTERHGHRPDTPDTEPSPTITSKASTARWYDRRQGHTTPGGARQMVPLRPDTEPTPTLGAIGLAKSRDQWVSCADPQRLKGDDWPERRPATTIAADPRVFQPGGHHGNGEQSANAERVTLEEAAILQGFPADYPFQGSRTARFTQIGNAVPPPLARVVVEALLATLEPAE